MRTRQLLTAGLVCGIAGGCGHGGTPGACLNHRNAGGRLAVYLAMPRYGATLSQTAVRDTARIMCERAREAGLKNVGVRRLGLDRIEVTGSPRSIGAVTGVGALSFYDWEPNLFVDLNGKVTRLAALEHANPQQGIQVSNAGALPLFQAVELASKQKPTATANDLPPDGPSKTVVRSYHGDRRLIRQYYDRRNDSSGEKYYLFGPAAKGGQRQLIRPGGASTAAGAPAPANDASAYYASCGEIASDFNGASASGPSGGTAKAPSGTACPGLAKALRGKGPPQGSVMVNVPRGIVVIKQEEIPGVPNKVPLGYYVLEDDSELSGSDITDPKQGSDPQTSEPIVFFQFTDAGRKAFARVTKREALRGQNLLAPGVPNQTKFQHFAISLDNQIVSLATVSYTDNPKGIPGSTGAQISGIGSLQQTHDLAQNLRTGALPVRLLLVRFRPATG